MNKVKIKEGIQTDLDSIKYEINENPRIFMQNLITSLNSKKSNPFSAYKIVLSLTYLKQVYERVFPRAKRGGPRISKSKESKKVVRNSLSDQVTPSVTWVMSSTPVDKTIVTNLIKGIRYVKKVPSFVELIGLRSVLKITAIQNRIRVGNYIVNCLENSQSIALFRSNKITHTELLKIVIEEEKKKKKKI